MGRARVRVFTSILTICWAAAPLFVETARGATCERWAARVTSVQGSVETLRGGASEWQAAGLNDTCCAGDKIRVLAKSRADLVLASGAVMRLNENSAVTVEEAKKEGSSLVDLAKGAAHFFSRKPSSLDVKTPYTIAGVRGTEFLIAVDGERTLVSVFNGAVVAQNQAGSLDLRSGQAAVAEAGKAPVPRVIARPRDAVTWALYYPPVLSAVAGGPAGPRLREASELLAVGRVAEAQASLAEASKLDPASAEVYALQSIVAVVQNDKDKAFDLAQTAVKTNAKSAAAYLSLSYAQQARFDLEGARKSLGEAVRVEPENALAWARLAEVHSMFGDLRQSAAAAQRAAQLAPRLSRVQTVLGFADLLQVKLGPAKEAFGKAIEYDQADPMPRLGLGLAMIREGRLEEGGKELEIAASLDPNNSLVRSYLGKVYYEEKRTGLDEREYKVAKELDPNDPTPWFYEAIAKQTANRPIEALHAYQRSVELNDNRAVYRSKLLLDSDEAARSAGLARIYSDLGFQQRALAEGWSSVTTDPTNYSPHRFLADSYSALPRHEIARVSELLQSQLLQPLNITPLQPTLAESNLFLLSSLGPANLSFNEFSPLLFSRNRAVVTGSGLWGEHGTFAGEGVVAGIYNRFSLSAGFSRFRTDGWRDNSSQEDTVGNVFAQVELSNRASVQAEFRRRSNEYGDLQQRFFTDDFSPSTTNRNEIDSLRAGLRYALSPQVVLLANVQHQNASSKVRNDIPEGGFLFVDDVDVEGNGGEAQGIFRSERLTLIGGAGYFALRGEDEIAVTVDGEPLSPFTVTRDATHANLYLYALLPVLKEWLLILGGSADFYDPEVEGAEGRNQLSPKAGLIWTPLPDTKLRLAAFRVLKRTLVTNQTLEPTEVAGFNQFYDDIDATSSWRFGAAVDQRFSRELFGGAEFSRRDLSVPFQSASTGESERAKWHEKLGRAYLYWTPHSLLALKAEYLYEKFRRAEEMAFGVKELSSHRVPLGVTLFHPCGLTLSAKETYFRQEGDFERTPLAFVHGKDAFWLTDAHVQYRFPRRYGLLTLGIQNLFDRHFSFYDTDLANPPIQPTRTFFGALTVALP